ncbi:MAG: sulfite exporter TauE/SafE family protein [Cyclobacteriaceae bacterium]
MELTTEYWFMFPVAIMVSTIAMSTGVGGAVFFSPIFILVLGLEPYVAIGTALTTQLFGVSSGFVAYARSRLIDYRLGGSLLVYSIPFAIAGTWLSRYVNPDVLKAIFAVGIIFIGTRLYKSWRKMSSKASQSSENVDTFRYQLTDNEGNIYRYNIRTPKFGKFLAALGGGFLGMISVGLSELQEYHLVVRSKVPLPVAIATAIFIASVTVLTASLGHFYKFIVFSSQDTFSTVINIIIFSIPGVLIGGQLGPRLQKKLPASVMKIAIAIIFFIIGTLLLISLILSHF